MYAGLLLVYGVLAAMIGAYGLAQAQLLWLAWRGRPGAREGRFPIDGAIDGDLPSVTVQLPVYNEAPVVQGLLRSIAGLDWPRDRLQIQLLDDSTDETPALAAVTIAELGLPIEHVRRADRQGYKAGALDHGLATARGELIAIFDSDFRPRPDFLRLAVAALPPDVGLVQARWSWINRQQNLFTRLLSLHLDAHFAVEQPGRHAGDLFWGFNGTAGVWRRACIDDAGGWQADTLTEDLDLAYRARLAGWKLGYVEAIDAPSEVPSALAAIRSQQFRWMKGGAQVARKMLGPVWRSGESFGTKVQATAHLAGGALFLAVVILAVLTPGLVRAATTGPAWFGAAATLVSLPMQGTLVVLAGVYLRTCLRRGGGVLRWAWEFPLLLVFSVGLSLHNGLAVLDGWRGRPSPFVRTPKAGDGALRLVEPEPPVVWAELALGLWLAWNAAWLAHDGRSVAVFVGLQALGFLTLAALSLRLVGKGALVALLLGLVGLGAMEAGLRATGARPASEPAPAFVTEPAPLVQPDERLGYRLRDGEFATRFGAGHEARSRHAGGRRVGAAEGRPRSGRSVDAPGRLDLHGGSFAYGLGIEDGQTLADHLQARTSLQVVNDGVPGWGPLQAWLTLEQQVAEGGAPDALWLLHASFQDERVSAVRNWRRAIAPWRARLSVTDLPVARNHHGTPRVQRRPLAFRPLPGASSSALLARLDLGLDLVDDLRVDSHKASRNLIVQLGRAAEAAGSSFLLVGLQDDRWTRDTLRFAERRGLRTVDVALPWREPPWNLAPWTHHPGSAAYAEWARRLEPQLPGQRSPNSPR